MNVSEVLNAAADGLERDGWMSPGCMSHGSNPTCAQVAIGRIEAPRETLNGADRALWSYLGGTMISDIWHWNDKPGRTAEQVIEALRAAAIIEAAKEVDAHTVTRAQVLAS